ncbi:MAG: DUF6390 family protein [Patescibacteria group bacterium]|nr:DUF6390 family protein [Patescibacteria group bacterium]
MNGLWRCAKYAFSPNYLKYCGPDKNEELKGYLQSKSSDQGLQRILAEFAAMYPYLKLIAQENGIGDPFDERVVEAYWLGNTLLDKVSLKGFFSHVERRLPRKDLKWFELKLPIGAKPNHSFHVFNFWKRTGHLARLHTLETMDNCRISAGEIIPATATASGSIVCDSSDDYIESLARHLRATFAVGRNLYLIKTDKLIYKNGRLELEPTIKEVQSLEAGYKPGDLVSFHWNRVCEKITKEQAKNLQKYTDLASKLANITI